MIDEKFFIPTVEGCVDRPKLAEKREVDRGLEPKTFSILLLAEIGRAHV